MAAGDEQARAAFSRLLRQPVVALAGIGGGRNSRIYRLQTGGGALFAGKEYFVSPADPRPRLQTEVRALRFLRGRGVAEVPEPVAADEARHLAVFSFVEGERPGCRPVRDADLEAAAGFLARLRPLGRQPQARTFGPASAACLAVADVHGGITSRLERLLDQGGEGEEHQAMTAFLIHALVPFYDRLRSWSRAMLRREGIDEKTPLAPEERTLSPSDFGMHNAVRTPDGSLVFLDFEYFGWDDPAKMIADFLLHPAMELTAAQRRRFTGRMLEVFADQPLLLARLRVLYPLLGILWCLILLNEFVAVGAQRRRFAGVLPAGGETERLQAQLAAARAMFDRVRREYREFPYA